MAEAKTKELSTAAKLAIALQENRELTRKLYTLRGEAPPPSDGAAGHAGGGLVQEAARAEVAAQQGLGVGLRAAERADQRQLAPSSRGRTSQRVQGHAGSPPRP